ncbi:MAG: carboxymuconolactone decarboxylase family protein [Bacteriovoracales bacterium]
MKFISFLAFLFLFSVPGISKEKISSNPQRDAALKEIKNTFGLVPKFYELYPADGVFGAWEEMKTHELNPKTALPGLYKELIGLAVASQIPCRYCIYFHTKAAKLNGGTDQQIREAIAIAGIVRFWSTYFEGMLIDKKDFMKETDKIMEIQKKRMDPSYKPPVLPPLNVTDAETAYQDIERSLGMVPFFVKPLPKNSVAGIWLTIKGIFFNPASSIPLKIKALIALGVQGQVPNRHGTYWDIEMSKLHGASDQERVEAVEMAATTRHWSTWLNGNLFDENAFKKEVDKAFAFVKKHSAK